MTGADVNLDPHCASAEMLSVLYSLYPGFRLIDGVFPQLPLSWRHGGGLALDLAGAPAPRDAFYARFRQLGGHAPLLGPDTLLAYLRAADVAARPPATTVFAAPAQSVGALLELVAPAALENDVVLLQDAEKPAAELAAAGFPAALKLTFQRPNRSQNYVLASRRELDDRAFESVLDALRQVAVDIGRAPGEQGRGVLRIELPAEGYRPVKAQILPSHFVHDGARRSEGDAAYSWIWTGAERRIRILLGCVPSHYRKLRIVVPNATPVSNLSAARVFLNGELAASRSESWGGSSGAVDVALSPQADELVMTLATPEAEGGLSICIDRIELSA